MCVGKYVKIKNLKDNARHNVQVVNVKKKQLRTVKLHIVENSPMYLFQRESIAIWVMHILTSSNPIKVLQCRQWNHPCMILSMTTFSQCTFLQDQQ